MNIGLIKDIFMWYGIVGFVISVVMLACHGIRKAINAFRDWVVKGVVDSPRIEHFGIPNASKLPDRNIPMTIDGSWATVNIDSYIESYLKIKGLIKEE